jgi:hypothetical protein
MNHTLTARLQCVADDACSRIPRVPRINPQYCVRHWQACLRVRWLLDSQSRVLRFAQSYGPPGRGFRIGKSERMPERAEVAADGVKRAREKKKA